MHKKVEVEVVEKTPNPNLKIGQGILPNTFHKVRCSPVSLGDCEKIYTVACIPCPWINQYVAASECETCKHGKSGSYSEGWVMCNFTLSTKQRKEVEE